MSDSLGLVHAYPAFYFPSKAYRRAIAHFLGLVEETGIREAVIGYPLNMDGSEGPSALRSRRFKEIVERENEGIVVHLVDERLSTMEAMDNLAEMGIRGAKRKKELVDSEAAAIILERYLSTMEAKQ